MKKHLLILVAIFAGYFCLAQIPDLNWEHYYAQPQQNFEAVDLTHDGKYIIGGSSKGQSTKNAMLMKVDVNGDTLWRKDYSGSNSSSAFYSIATVKDGNIVAVGSTSIIRNSNISSKGGGDLYVAKVNSTNGEILWQKLYGGSKEDYGFSVSATSDGGCIVGGLTSSMDGDITGAKGNEDAWILKLDADGELEWSIVTGDTKGDRVTKIRETSDKGFICIGYQSPTDNYSADPYYATNMWVAKLSQSGEILWEKILEGNNYDKGKDIRETSDNGFILCGESNSNSGEFNYTTGQYDMWIIKLDDSGEILWKNRYGSADGDYPFAVGETSEGYVMIGHTIGSYTLDYWVTMLTYDKDDGTNTKWKFVSDSSYCTVTDMKVIPSNSFVYVGSKAGSYSRAKAYLAKYGDDNPPIVSTTSIEQQLASGYISSIYPNPAVEELNIILSQKTDLSVVNLLGEVVYADKGDIGENKISLTRFSPGIYYVISGAGKAQKFVISK
jgi:hypothetical protein